MSDEALLRAVGQGDHDAFAKLYTSTRQAMLAHATGILGGDSFAAEDAVDEAFAEIWRLAGKFNAIGSASAWIRRIVRNKAVDMLRKPAKRETGQSDSYFAAIEDSSPTPEQEALIGDERRWLREALAVLNSDQREVIVLCYYQEMSVKEIADATGSAVNTVKTRLFYARRKLHDWIEAHNSVERQVIARKPATDAYVAA